MDSLYPILVLFIILLSTISLIALIYLTVRALMHCKSNIRDTYYEHLALKGKINLICIQLQESKTPKEDVKKMMSPYLWAYRRASLVGFVFLIVGMYLSLFVLLLLEGVLSVWHLLPALPYEVNLSLGAFISLSIAIASSSLLGRIFYNYLTRNSSMTLASFINQFETKKQNRYKGISRMMSKIK